MGYALVIGLPVGPMIGHKIGFAPERNKYSVNSLPSILTTTPFSDRVAVSSAAAADGRKGEGMARDRKECPRKGARQEKAEHFGFKDY